MSTTISRAQAGAYRASAPSNIALVKYMGKVDGAGNKPTNASLSYTLEHLRTYVELAPSHADQDRWEPLAAWGPEHEAAAIRAEKWESGEPAAVTAERFAELAPLSLSTSGQARFLAHLGALKEGWGYKGSFVVRSANGFPSDCGLASSASAFAALTSAAAQALTELTGSARPTSRDLAELSRRGSGSSCRSFFSPWGLWADGGASGIDLPERGLIHQTIVVSEEIKAVSSSEAHVRVAKSSLFGGRPERANFRLGLLVAALSNGSRGWREAFEVSWAEFWDMHALFETCAPPFGYMAPGSLEALRYARDVLWEKAGEGPIATMDAGPNVHFLFRPDQVELAERTAHELGRKHRVIASS